MTHKIKLVDHTTSGMHGVPFSVLVTDASTHGWEAYPKIQGMFCTRSYTPYKQSRDQAFPTLLHLDAAYMALLKRNCLSEIQTYLTAR